MEIIINGKKLEKEKQVSKEIQLTRAIEYAIDNWEFRHFTQGEVKKICNKVIEKVFNN